jgi:hypothetical protein
LAAIQKKLLVFSSWSLADTMDGRFANLPRVFSRDDADNFIAGVTAGIAGRRDRIRKAIQKKAQKKLEESNAAAGKTEV